MIWDVLTDPTVARLIRLAGIELAAVGIAGLGYVIGRASAIKEFARNRNRKWFTGDGYNVDHQNTFRRD